MDKELRDLYAKFTGPSFSALLELKKNKEHSLLRAVEFKSPAELGYIVVGKAAYETIVELPEEREMVVSQTYKQFCATVFQRCSAYAWVAAGYVDTHPGHFSTPADYAFDEVPVDTFCQEASGCSSLAFIRCCWFQKLLCFALQRIGLEYIMKPLDMMQFIKFIPFKVLPKQLFKPFESSVKNFLTNHLFHFYINKLMFKRPPSFPADNALPKIFNAFDTGKNLNTDSPNLAAIKKEMVHNVSHFALTYCLDWIAEVLSLHNVEGMVKYGFPALDVRGKTGAIPCSTSGVQQPPRNGPKFRRPPGGPQSRDYPQPPPAAVQVPGGAAYHLSELPSRLSNPQQESSQKERYDQMPSRPEFRHEQPQQELFQQEPWQQGPSRPEPWRRYPPQQEPWPQEPLRQEPWRQEPPRQEPLREEPTRQEPWPVEPPRQEPWRREPPRQEGWAEESRRDERPPQEPPRQERRQEEPRREERAPYVNNSRPLSSEPDHLLDESDDWSEMLRMAQSDPKLPMHYKTMIGCLIASNRELSNILESLKS
ncbi:unnamed protein product [Heligmosomoides polygyrus]|uniref:Transp_Tc5_C domain-containing protein n=1 Tax=Heligmosomoides polygyrus TaxID=6339 RepID=A0A183G3L6_HELPZ|nr:unnamed protein product [Heligmosomoides polygyrus]